MYCFSYVFKLWPNQGCVYLILRLNQCVFSHHFSPKCLFNLNERRRLNNKVWNKTATQLFKCRKEEILLKLMSMFSQNDHSASSTCPIVRLDVISDNLILNFISCGLLLEDKAWFIRLSHGGCRTWKCDTITWWSMNWAIVREYFTKFAKSWNNFLTNCVCKGVY